MKNSYRAVIIGGGVVGASVLYHLTKLGWSDVALIERKELTAGSTWHAAAGYHALNPDPNVAALQNYTINLYEEIQAESGQNVGLHKTGGVSFATNPARWEQLKAAWATFQAIGVTTARLMDREEIAEVTGGIMWMEDILGGLYDANQGYLDPYGATHAFAGAAKKRGAEVILRNRVVELHHRADGLWDVVSEHGTLCAEHVINAAGLWAKQVGRMAGVELPVSPMEHHYLITDSLESLRKLPHEVPVINDLDGFTYVRQEHQGLLLGVYERNPKHWHMDGAPWDYGMDLIPEDVERIGEELSIGFARYPELAETGIKKWVNGAFTFAPDGNPLVGPVGPRGYWVACGVMAGFCQGGGVGKSLAEWIVNGVPEEDIYGMDIARFGPHHANKEYIRQTTGQFYARRFVFTYPNEQLPAGRKLRLSGAHEDMSKAGARWGNNWGLETPLYFAPAPDFEEPGTLRRSAAFPIVAAECQHTTQAASLLDISGFSRYRVTGKGARVWLDRLLACKLPEVGRGRLAPMLAEDGRLRGDLTCFHWQQGEYWLMGSYYLRAYHKRWFDQQMQDDVTLEDVSDRYHGFSVNGPNARVILQSLTDSDLSSIKMMQGRIFDIGLHQVRLARLSLSGELAYEVHCHASEHASLRKTLLQAGKASDLREIGFNAMYSMRLEKSIGIWSREFTQGYTAQKTGLDRWIDFSKDFIGRDSVLNAPAPKQVLRMLEVEVDNADCAGYEPIWQDDRLVGITTSGAFGHRMQKSYAMGMVACEIAKLGTSLEIHVMGEKRRAKIIDFSPYDRLGKLMRN